MQLTLSKSTVRSFEAGDVDSLARQIGTLSVTRNMAVIPHPYTLGHAREWITTARSRTPQTHFAIAINEAVVGGIGFETDGSSAQAIRAHSAEVGYWLGESFWGRGIMTEVLIALSDWAFSELGLIRLHAAVFARNPASARVLAKAGYQFEARQRAAYLKQGELIDALLYAKVRPPR